MSACIVFYANGGKSSAAVSVRREAADLAQEFGYQCIEIDEACQFPDVFHSHIHFLVAIGGDGTILRAANVAAGFGVAVLGINAGRVGFLSEIQPDVFASALLRISRGEYYHDDRMMLACLVNGKEVCTCLNEALLYRRSLSGTVQVEMLLNGLQAGTVFADGVMVCTPTGSTGYSISAGGPIVSPGMEACVVTPICPHSLWAKPIVCAPGSHMEFTMQSAGYLHADGQKIMELNEGDVIEVKKAKIFARFLRFEEKNLFRLIRDKLI